MSITHKWTIIAIFRTGFLWLFLALLEPIYEVGLSFFFVSLNLKILCSIEEAGQEQNGLRSQRITLHMVIKRLFIPYAEATFHDHCYIYLYNNLCVSFSVWIVFTKLKYRIGRIRNGHIDLVRGAFKRSKIIFYIYISIAT